MRWVIDVCVVCGRHAKWPFCEHRELGPGWCMPVAVTTTPGVERKLRQSIREAESRAAMEGSQPVDRSDR